MDLVGTCPKTFWSEWDRRGRRRRRSVERRGMALVHTERTREARHRTRPNPIQLGGQ